MLVTQGGETPGRTDGPSAPVDADPVEQLRARVRRAAQRRAALASSPVAGAQARLLFPSGDAPPIDWSALTAALQQAEQYAPLGRRLPPLPARIPRPLRFVVVGVARMALGFSRYLLTEQREFNNAVLVGLRALQRGLYQSEQRAARLEQEVCLLREIAGNKVTSAA